MLILLFSFCEFIALQISEALVKCRKTNNLKLFGYIYYIYENEEEKIRR